MRKLFEAQLTKIHDDDLVMFIDDHYWALHPKLLCYLRCQDKFIPIRGLNNRLLHGWDLFLENGTYIAQIDRFIYTNSILLVFKITDIKNKEKVFDFFNYFKEDLMFIGVEIKSSLDNQKDLSEAKEISAKNDKKEKAETGSTYRNDKRYEIFSKIKTDHPGWSQAKVAQEATKIDGIIYTEDTVRNTYRKKRVHWDRGDRVR